MPSSASSAPVNCRPISRIPRVALRIAPAGRALEPRSPDSDGIRLYQVDPARLHRLFQDGTLDKNGSIVLSDGEKLVTAPSELAPYRIELQEVTEQGSRGTMFVRVPAKAPKSALAPPAGFRALEGYKLKPGRYQLVAAYRSKILNWRDYPRLRRLPATLVRVLRFLHLAPADQIDEMLVEAEPSRVDIEVRP